MNQPGKKNRTDAPTAARKVASEEAMRTLADLVRRLEDPPVSWNTARRWIEQGKITVNETCIRDASQRLQAGDEIALDMTARVLPPSHLPTVSIVYEDIDVVIIDKPAGVNSVPFERRESGTAMDLLRTSWRIAGKSGNEQPLFIVHRIDKDTSGLLAFAKTKPAEASLAKQFRLHTIERSYLCVVHGHLAAPRRIETALLENRGDGLRGSKRAHHGAQRGKRAVTHVEPLDLGVVSAELGLGDVPLRLREAATLCRVRLETGKTHQIRIHLSEIGHPLVGERVYIRDYLRQGGVPLEASRLLLHAEVLGFARPHHQQGAGRRVHLEAPLPDDFRQALRSVAEQVRRLKPLDRRTVGGRSERPPAPRGRVREQRPLSYGAGAGVAGAAGGRPPAGAAGAKSKAGKVERATLPSRRARSRKSR